MKKKEEIVYLVFRLDKGFVGEFKGGEILSNVEFPVNLDKFIVVMKKLLNDNFIITDDGFVIVAKSEPVSLPINLKIQNDEKGSN